MLRLDRSRKDTISSVHGERAPEDPHYAVCYWQDELPFDVEGRLVPDAGSARVQGMLEGKPVVYDPLYNDARRKKLQDKLTRLAKHLPDEPDPAKATKAISAEDAAEVAEVNLEQWLRGNRKYEFHLIHKAVLSVYKTKVQNLRDAVQLLVNKEEIILPAEVAAQYQVFLEKEGV